MKTYTREEIQNMPAGREMDALIFEYVFGFEKGTFPVYEPMKSKRGDYMVRPIREYSIDISAADEALDTLVDLYDCEVSAGNKKYPEGRLSFCYIEGGKIEYDNPRCMVIARAKEKPLAICRAALLATME